MTWFASHIFAVPRADVLARFQAQEPLCRGLYLVRDLEGHSWHREEIRHGLPAGGLLVCRELCDTDHPDAMDVHWYGNDVLPWWGVRGRPTTQILPSRWGVFAGEEETDAATPDSDDTVRDHYPPQDLLRFLKDVSDDTSTPVAYYQCAMWGGSIDNEYAWVFGEDDYLYRTATPPTIQVQTPVGNWTWKGDVLRLTLSHFGLDLPTPYFALMTRAFPWERYRLPPG